MTPSDTDKALQALADADWDEKSQVTVVIEQRRNEQPTQPDSEPPSDGAISIHGPSGTRISRAPPWLVLALGVVAIVAACWAYVATH